MARPAPTLAARLYCHAATTDGLTLAGRWVSSSFAASTNVVGETFAATASSRDRTDGSTAGGTFRAPGPHGETRHDAPQARCCDLPTRFALPLIGDTLAFASDPSGFLGKRAAELGPVFKVELFGHPTACFVGPEAFALLLDDNNVERAGANPPHVQAIFNPQALPFLDGAAQKRRKRLLMHAFREEALAGYLPVLEQVIERYARRWSSLGPFSWVPELDALGFGVAGALFV